MFSMMLLNHVCDQFDSLECANGQYSHRQSSMLTCERCAHDHVSHRPWGGGLLRKRESCSGIFYQYGDLVFCVPYGLTNQATQSSHPEESGRAHRL